MTVILSATRLLNPAAPNGILLVTAGPDGRYCFSGMAPGQFNLIAFTGLRDAAVSDPDFVSNLIDAV